MLVRPKAKWVRVLYLVGVGVVLFVLFDRGVFFLLRETAFGFYRSSQPKKDWYGQSSWFKKNYFNTLIVGTSRTKEGIHPLYLYEQLGLRAYNAASPGRYARFNYLFYREFKRQNGKPKIVIYGIDYFLFSKTSSPGQLQQLRGEGKAAVKRIDHRQAANKGSPLFNRVSLLFRTKPHLDQYFADTVDYLSMALENRQNRDILPAGISTYIGLYGTVKDQDNQPSPNRERPPISPFPVKRGIILTGCWRSCTKTGYGYSWWCCPIFTRSTRPTSNTISSTRISAKWPGATPMWSMSIITPRTNLTCTIPPILPTANMGTGSPTCRSTALKS